MNTVEQHVADMHITYDRGELTDEELLTLYRGMKKPRLIEEKMLILLRQGKISKWFSGWGQEAISVGCAMAIKPEEFILPMHRNLGVFTSRGIELNRLFCQFQGKMSGFTKGRDRSFHFGSKEHRIVGMISHLGPQLGIADGIALASKLNNEKQVALVFSGDGGASEGDFHEALNVAAVWDLPVIFCVENNQWGLSTPSREQFRCENFIDKGVGYGMDAYQIDGNNIIDVYSSVKKIAQSLRENPRPFLLELMTFRMRGHEEASGTKYYPEGLQDQWDKKDPVRNYELYLKSIGLLDEKMITELEAAIKAEIQNGLDLAFAEEKIAPDTAQELADLFMPFDATEIQPKTDKKTEKRFVDAVSDSLKQAMARHPNLVIMGQDVGEYGGVFKVTEGFVDLFGKERVRNTPLCESAIVGAGLGLSIKGMKAVVEMQFADFVTCGFNQIVNNLAKIHWRWGQNADVVVRMPTGAGAAAGPFHSQSNEAWFTHTPGLKVVYPAFPNDAKGLLSASIEDPNPVMFFEHKYLYRSVREDVYDDYFTLELGKAAVRKTGTKATIITYGLGVHWALDYAAAHPEKELEVIDLRTLAPLDYDTVFKSVRKTSRVLVLHEDCLTGGIGGEIASRITEECFESLDAPVLRLASLDTPIPFAADLELNFLPQHRLDEKINQLLAY
jgi:2-oxoisovalerate dehydrogenase E1 component